MCSPPARGTVPRDTAADAARDDRLEPLSPDGIPSSACSGAWRSLPAAARSPTSRLSARTGGAPCSTSWSPSSTTRSSAWTAASVRMLQTIGEFAREKLEPRRREGRAHHQARIPVRRGRTRDPGRYRGRRPGRLCRAGHRRGEQPADCTRNAARARAGERRRGVRGGLVPHRRSVDVLAHPRQERQCARAGASVPRGCRGPCAGASAEPAPSSPPGLASWIHGPGQPGESRSGVRHPGSRQRSAPPASDAWRRCASRLACSGWTRTKGCAGRERPWSRAARSSSTGCSGSD